ncbi:SDR family NAD(P)-dependent oxidoreductase [Ferrovibrio xuzhouensis]|uniref:SDR family NAD(P)-dependent oxidoreductase n=1 Tax=Ferrovibrio xuzhouensis TaxID=1576914 RepID=A0ABV7VMV9_9PROT
MPDSMSGGGPIGDRQINSINLRGRVAIVTGGSAGIGLAVAKRFLASGAQVAIWGRNAERLKSAEAILADSSRIHTSVVDVIDEAAIQGGIESVIARFGRLDILVNNAGILGPRHPVWEYPAKAWREVLEINLTGAFLCSKAAAPHMRRQKYGRVVNIGSASGKDGNPYVSAYSAAKAGLIALTKALAKETATDGVLVNCVTPSASETEIFGELTDLRRSELLSRVPMKRFVDVGEIAALVAWLSSEECSFSTGATFDITGGRTTF